MNKKANPLKGKLRLGRKTISQLTMTNLEKIRGGSQAENGNLLSMVQSCGTDFVKK